MGKPIQQSLDIIKGAQKKANELLIGPEHINNLLEINAMFQRLITRLTFMGAVTEPDLKASTDSKFPPIKNFMGDKIIPRAAVTAKDLSPKEHEKKIYLEKVDSLWSRIQDMDTAKVLENYSIPQDQLVLRGVAKRAGVPDFDKRVINTGFVEDVQLAVGIKNEEGVTQSKVDAAAKPTITEDGSEVIILTQELIDADSNLLKAKAEPGDTLTTAKNGQKTISKAQKAK